MPCNAVIDSSWNGFCECAFGNVQVRAGHEKFTCAEECRRMNPIVEQCRFDCAASNTCCNGQAGMATADSGGERGSCLQACILVRTPGTTYFADPERVVADYCNRLINQAGGCNLAGFNQCGKCDHGAGPGVSVGLCKSDSPGADECQVGAELDAGPSLGWTVELVDMDSCLDRLGTNDMTGRSSECDAVETSGQCAAKGHNCPKTCGLCVTGPGVYRLKTAVQPAHEAPHKLQRDVPADGWATTGEWYLTASGASYATSSTSSQRGSCGRVTTVVPELWLQADSIDGNLGDSVSSWTDKSGSGNHFSSSAATPWPGCAEPKLSDFTEVDGQIHRTVRFGGDDHATPTCLLGPNMFMDSTEGMEVWIVARQMPTNSVADDRDTVAMLFDVGAHRHRGYGLSLAAERLWAHTPTHEELGGATIGNADGKRLFSPSHGLHVLRLRVEFHNPQSQSGRMSLERDGVVLASEEITLAGLTESEVSIDDANPSNGGPFVIGQISKDHEASERNKRFFRGDVTEFRVYDGLLPPSEASALLAALSTGMCPALGSGSPSQGYPRDERDADSSYAMVQEGSCRDLTGGGLGGSESKPVRFVDMGSGCCAGGEGIFGGGYSVDRSACEAKCAADPECNYYTHGWIHDDGRSQHCALKKKCKFPLNAGPDDCGSQGDQGVRVYRRWDESSVQPMMPMTILTSVQPKAKSFKARDLAGKQLTKNEYADLYVCSPGEEDCSPLDLVLSPYQEGVRLCEAAQHVPTLSHQCDGTNSKRMFSLPTYEYDGPHDDKYLGGCTADGCKDHGSLQAAMTACNTDDDCGGVTSKTSGEYQTRKGTRVQTSPSKEKSWVKPVPTLNLDASFTLSMTIQSASTTDGYDGSGGIWEWRPPASRGKFGARLAVHHTTGNKLMIQACSAREAGKELSSWWDAEFSGENFAIPASQSADVVLTFDSNTKWLEFTISSSGSLIAARKVKMLNGFGTEVTPNVCASGSGGLGGFLGTIHNLNFEGDRCVSCLETYKNKYPKMRSSCAASNSDYKPLWTPVRAADGHAACRRPAPQIEPSEGWFSLGRGRRFWTPSLSTNGSQRHALSANSDRCPNVRRRCGVMDRRKRGRHSSALHQTCGCVQQPGRPHDGAEV